MCRRGDIILVEKYKSQGADVSHHSFVVIDDKDGQIKGLNYDIVALAMSSFKDEKQKEKKLSYPGNFPITANEENVDGGNKRDGYIKADQFYFFDKSKIEFDVIGAVTVEAFTALIEFMNRYLADGYKIEPITDNL